MNAQITIRGTREIINSINNCRSKYILERMKKNWKKNNIEINTKLMYTKTKIKHK